MVLTDWYKNGVGIVYVVIEMSRAGNGLQVCITYDDMSYKIPTECFVFLYLIFFECTIANVLVLDMIVMFEFPRAWASWSCPVVVVVQ